MHIFVYTNGKTHTTMKTVTTIHKERVFKVLGFTEDVNECGCCGRQDLKGTIALESNETGEVVYYGVVCAAKAEGFTKKVFETELKAELKALFAAAKKELAESAELAAYDKYITDTEEAIKAAFKMDTPEELHKIWAARAEASKPVNELKERIKAKYFIKFI